MLGPNKQTAIFADEIFPSQIEVDHRTFKLALLRFFREMNKLCPQDKLVYFFENYYSENGMTWAIHKGIRYFILVLNAGTSMEEKYYGQQIVDFNLI